MRYDVRVTERAQRDLAAIFHAIHTESSAAARRWFAHLSAHILSLESLPERCPAAPENASLRHLLVGRKPHVYRVIYRVVPKQREVQILYIRHGARKALRPRPPAPS